MELLGMDTSNLKGSDICLYHGEGWISKAIRYVDGTEVNHVSILVGDNRVIEAEGGRNRICKNTIESSINGSSWIKVYRLKERPVDMSPVTETRNISQNATFMQQFLTILLEGGVS